MDLVNIWIKSDKCFHIIRDHPRHTQFIMGGMFGVKVKEFNKKYGKVDIDKHITNYKKCTPRNIKKNTDQAFLKKIIYPKIIKDNMAHVSLKGLKRSNNDILIPSVKNFIGKANFKPEYKFTS